MHFIHKSVIGSMICKKRSPVLWVDGELGAQRALVLKVQPIYLRRLCVCVGSKRLPESVQIAEVYKAGVSV